LPFFLCRSTWKYLEEQSNVTVRNNLIDIELALYDQCQQNSLTSYNAVRPILWKLVDSGADTEVKGKFTKKLKA
jgi:hypothetical protein